VHSVRFCQLADVRGFGFDTSRTAFRESPLRLTEELADGFGGDAMTMIDTAMGALRGVIGNRRAEGFKLLGSRETGTGRIASAGRGIAGTLHGIRRLRRAAVLAL